MSVSAAQQITDWLEKLGLGQYAQRFAENDISFSVRPDLTDQDLKDIGVSLGHRRRLLREIANLGNTAAASPSAPSLTAPPVGHRPVEPEPESTGERCHAARVVLSLRSRRLSRSKRVQQPVQQLTPSTASVRLKWIPESRSSMPTAIANPSGSQTTGRNVCSVGF
jgi:SAM (Sterile alpha motif) domain-containing protein